MSQKLQKLFDRENEINKKVSFYNLPTIYNDQLFTVEKDLEILKEIWSLIGEWEIMWNTYQSGEFWSVDINDMEESVVSLYRKMNKLYGIHKDRRYEVLEVNLNKIERFKKTLPLIGHLKNPALKERHWSEVKRIVKKC